MAAIVRASHAISFQLLNRDRQPILGIFDGQQGQTLKLEITNSSSRDMKPKKLTGEATADNHHFELRFRPGTLVLTNTPAISVDEGDAGWKISKPTPTDDGVSFYLLITKPAQPAAIASGKAISATLNNLSGDGKRGAHGTRVELKWKDGSLEYSTSTSGQAEPLVAGHRIQYLSIVNESGQKHIPLHVGIVGNDKVLNNNTVNEFKLRITNLVKPDPLKPGEGNIELNPDLGPNKPPATKFIFSFDFSPITPQRQVKPWALGFQDEVGNIKIKGDETLFKIDQPVLGQSPVWIITPVKSITLTPGQAIELRVTEIKTTHPSGLTNLYIHYKNVPGYWDGDFVALIEKAPLVYKEVTIANVTEQRVGVGTNDPNEKLHVAGKLRVDGEVSAKTLRLERHKEIFFEEHGQIRSSDDGHRIMFRQTEDKLEFRERGQIIFSPGSADGSETAKVIMMADGRVGMGIDNPATHLHLKGVADQEIMIESTADTGVKWSLQSSAAAGRFEMINRTAGMSRLTILKDGNVGIGTVSPGSHINENDYFKADAQGRILEVHSPTRESVLILSTNQDADTAHLGGLYFTRTAGQGDAHREVAAIQCRQVNGGKLAGGHLLFFTKVGDGGVGPNSPRMVITDNGKVGIGTTTPAAPLHVIGGQANSFTLGRWMDGTGLGEKGGQRSDLKHSIIADERVRAAAFDTVSDARVKNVLGTSGGASDLDALLKIIITDYTYKDVIGKGNGTYKKVIGQQIEKVFPQAVSKCTDVVPDIYQPASIQDGWITLATDLKKGDRVKLIAESGEEYLQEVLEVTEDRFRVELESEGEKIFVYGREVDDFLTVDYDAIAMLNVSATQQLKKELDQELKALRVENDELRAANDALVKRLQLLENKLETALGVVAAHNGSNGNGRH